MKLVQGDVIFRTTNIDVTDLLVVEDNIVVAGGHNHMLIGGLLKQSADGATKYIVSTGEAVVNHPTHAPITFPAGTYVTAMTREYDHLAEEARNVRD